MDEQPAPAAITALATRLRGFTLVELLVAVAIAAILVSIALPVYLDSVRKGRRAEAFAAISAVQQRQERWRANNPTYTTSLSDLTVAEPALYALAIAEPGSPATLSNGYIVTATGRNAQASEKQCKKLSLRMVDGNIGYGSCESCSTFTYTATNACWSR